MKSIAYKKDSITYKKDRIDYVETILTNNGDGLTNIHMQAMYSFISWNKIFDNFINDNIKSIIISYFEIKEENISNFSNSLGSELIKNCKITIG